MAARDPYKYFRVEARELLEGLNQGVLELEKNGLSPEAVARVLRHAHTLKGASRVVRLGAVADLAHGIEEALAPLRQGAGEAPQALVEALLRLLDGVGRQLELLNAAPPAPPGEGRPLPEAPRAPDRRVETVRLEISELDGVLEGLRDAVGRLGVLRREASTLERARRMAQELSQPAALSGAQDQRWRLRARELDALLERFDRLALSGLEQAERELTQTHERAARMRLLPASALFDFLERTCRDAASALGKKLRFEAMGGEQRMDAPVLLALQEALQHVVRNAVVHGIEEPQARLAAGKPAEGLLRLELRRQGGRIRISCRDDGAGIDAAKVARAAAARGLRGPGEGPLGPDDAIALLLRGGLSTAERVTELSGRGLGLDVLRETVRGLKGELSLKSTPGQGLELTLQVPYSLSSFPALEVEASGLSSLIPFEAVQAALRLKPGEISHSAEGETLLVDGQALAYLPLSSCFGPAWARAGQAQAGLVIRGAAGLAALGVDRIVGLREAVMLPLPEMAPGDGVASGACLDAAGNPCLVLDPEGLLLAAKSRRGGPAAQPEGPGLPLLVIDDSLTTRMLEQSILETAGYAVATASSAEDGLEMARQRRFGLILVDVEMPGMDGFEFLERLKADPALRGIPSILVSSRSSREDLLRGQAAGARDYIVKGEFDQARLLKRIAELLA